MNRRWRLAAAALGCTAFILECFETAKRIAAGRPMSGRDWFVLACMIPSLVLGLRYVVTTKDRSGGVSKED